MFQLTEADVFTIGTIHGQVLNRSKLDTKLEEYTVLDHLILPNNYLIFFEVQLTSIDTDRHAGTQARRQTRRQTCRQTRRQACRQAGGQLHYNPLDVILKSTSRESPSGRGRNSHWNTIRELNTLGNQLTHSPKRLPHRG